MPAFAHKASGLFQISADILISGRVRWYTAAAVQMLSSLRKFNPLGVAASVGLRSALPKVLMGAALLGGSGSVLFAGSAQAACNVNVPFATWASGTPLTCEDKTFTYFSSEDLPASAGLDEVRASESGGVYLFSYDFNQSSAIAAFTLEYIATATSPFFFTEVDIDSTVPNQPPSENLVATWSTGSFATPVVVATLASVNGSADIAPVGGSPQTLYVTNVYASNGGVIDSFQNSYRQGTTRVPGPLPLLGAGMAFGFSRKLRSRIKSRVQA